MLKTIVLPNIFVETVIHFIFQDSQMNRKFKRTEFAHCYNVDFWSINASLLDFTDLKYLNLIKTTV